MNVGVFCRWQHNATRRRLSSSGPSLPTITWPRLPPTPPSDSEPNGEAADDDYAEDGDGDGDESAVESPEQQGDGGVVPDDDSDNADEENDDGGNSGVFTEDAGGSDDGRDTDSDDGDY